MGLSSKTTTAKTLANTLRNRGLKQIAVIKDPKQAPRIQKAMASKRDSEARDGQNKLWTPLGKNVQASHMKLTLKSCSNIRRLGKHRIILIYKYIFKNLDICLMHGCVSTSFHINVYFLDSETPTASDLSTCRVS